MPINYDKIIKALTKLGYVVIHQKGSHIVMQLADKRKYASIFGDRNPERMIVIPAHKPISKGMLRTILREVDLSVEELGRFD